jgi:O-antigen/teichoic acid export membrane protein
MIDSLKKRFLFKLSANFVGLLIGLTTQAIIPRGLGPKAYGDFSFLTDFFSKVFNFLDMSSSTCFYNKLSQRPNDSQLVSFYFCYSALISVIVVLFVMGTHLSRSYGLIWPGQDLSYVYLAVILAIFTLFSRVFNMLADAYGITVALEKIRMSQKILGLIILLLLYLFHQLQLTQFFFYSQFLLVFFIFALIWVIRGKGYFSRQNLFLSRQHIKNYGKEFYKYSYPLFFGALVGNAATILDRWFLQVFSGSEQQGFYGFACLIAMVFGIFTDAMYPLIAREFAINFIKKDLTQMASVFRRYIPFFYSIAAFFSCFIVFQAGNVISIMGGEQFKNAKMALIIMAFYPIHQAYGQLSGSLLLATDQTVLVSKISIFVYVIGIPLTYFLIAPQDRMGLNFGATGLAIKMIVLQAVGVNIGLYFNAKFLGLNFWKYVGHQVVIVGCFLLLAALSSFGVDYLFSLNGRFIVNFVSAGIIYSLLVLSMVCMFPRIVGLQGSDLKLIIDKVKQTIAS